MGGGDKCSIAPAIGDGMGAVVVSAPQRDASRLY